MFLASSVSGLFKWRQFEPEVILLAVGWYLRFSLSYRDVEELLAERGVHADHVTAWRWVQRYAPEMERRLRPRLRPTNDSWRVDSDLHSGQGQVALPVSCCGLFRCDDRLSPLGQAGRGLEQSASSLKLWEVRTIPSRALLTPTSTPLTHPRSSGSKPKVPLRRIANTAPYNISITSWNRTTGRSSAGYARASIFDRFGELGARRADSGRRGL